jgi:hypothetical protein
MKINSWHNDFVALKYSIDCVYKTVFFAARIETESPYHEERVDGLAV